MKKETGMGSAVEDLHASACPMAGMPELNGKGIYAVFLKPGCVLPGVESGSHGLLYIGMTNKSIRSRNHMIHAHSGASTLRRSLGALLREDLALVPVRRDSRPANADKFRFRDQDEKHLTHWMQRNLLVAQKEHGSGVSELETSLIQELQPPLNLTLCNNPGKAFISAARACCTRIVLAGFN